MTCTSCPSSPVTVEVLHVRHDPREGWLYRRTLASLPAHSHPDATARRLAGASRPSPVLHSTSWRHDADGLVLTYIQLPDPDTHGAAARLTALRTAHGTHAAAPAPATMTLDNVAAHALRHVALLLRTDAVVRSALGNIATPELLAALTELDPVPAGSLPTSSANPQAVPVAVRELVKRVPNQPLDAVMRDSVHTAPCDQRS